MRRVLVTLASPLVLLLVPFAASPAAADSYPGLKEQKWSWTQSGTGDSYVLTARIAIQVSTDGTKGNFRLRLACTKIDSETGSESGVRCNFQFNPDHEGHAYWVENHKITGRRDLTGWSNDFYHVWTGAKHTLRNGTTYATGVDAFRAVFPGVHTGAWHNIESYHWTR